MDRLTIAAQLATEDYDEAKTAYGTAVTRSLLARDQLATLQRAAADDDDRRERRVRALYMSGGRAALVDTVLGGRDLGEVSERVASVQAVVRDDLSRTASSDRRATEARAVSARLDALLREAERAKTSAEAAKTRVTDALAERRRLLDRATAEVRRLAEARRLAAERAAEDAAQATLAAAAGVSPAALPAQPGTAPTATAARAVAAARSRLGTPYVFGAEGPGAFDCSGLVQWAYARAGLTLPRTARPQYRATRRVALADMAPGDLIFLATDRSDPETIYHVALYIGGGLHIAAPQTGDVVRVQRVRLDRWFATTRPA